MHTMLVPLFVAFWFFSFRKPKSQAGMSLVRREEFPSHAVPAMCRGGFIVPSLSSSLCALPAAGDLIWGLPSWGQMDVKCKNTDMLLCVSSWILPMKSEIWWSEMKDMCITCIWSVCKILVKGWQFLMLVKYRQTSKRAKFFFFFYQTMHFSSRNTSCLSDFPGC